MVKEDLQSPFGYKRAALRVLGEGRVADSEDTARAYVSAEYLLPLEAWEVYLNSPGRAHCGYGQRYGDYQGLIVPNLVVVDYNRVDCHCEGGGGVGQGVDGIGPVAAELRLRVLI